MLFQVSGEGVKANSFDHRDNTFFNGGREIPVGGLADVNKEAGFSREDPRLAGGTGNDYQTWMAVGKSQVKGRGAQ
jgi:hypothetical protein